MLPTIELTPKITLSPNQELGTFLTASVDLLWHSAIEEPEPHEEALCEIIKARRPGPSDQRETPSAVYRARSEDPEHECLATLTAQLVKGTNTNDVDGLLAEFDQTVLSYDSLSSEAGWLAVTVAYAQGRQKDLIEAAANAADDGCIAWIGVIESWRHSSMLNAPETFTQLIDALGVLTNVFSGLFLVGAINQPNTSAHERLKAITEAARWDIHQPTTEGKLRVAPDAESEKNTLLLFAGVQNMGGPAEDYRAKLILPEGCSPAT